MGYIVETSEWVENIDRFEAGVKMRPAETYNNIIQQLTNRTKYLHQNLGLTKEEILRRIKLVDGPDSGLNADTVDGLHAWEIATPGLTAAEMLVEIKTVDGNSSGLDADMLDGLHGNEYVSGIELDNHVANLSIHREIDDNSISSTDLWSAEKITSAITAGTSGPIDADTLTGLTVAQIKDTGLEILEKLKPVDGETSGLDADTLDGYHATEIRYGIDHSLKDNEECTANEKILFLNGIEISDNHNSLPKVGFVIKSENSERYLSFYDTLHVPQMWIDRDLDLTYIGEPNKIVNMGLWVNGYITCSNGLHVRNFGSDPVLGGTVEEAKKEGGQLILQAGVDWMPDVNDAVLDIYKNEIRLFYRETNVMYNEDKWFSIDANIYPWFDNVFDIGTPYFRYNDIYATNTSIQTSDIRQKDNIQSLGNNELDLILNIEPISFKWKNSVTESIKETKRKPKMKTVLHTIQRTKLVNNKWVQIDVVEEKEEQEYILHDLYDKDGNIIGKHRELLYEEVEIEKRKKCINTYNRTHYGVSAQQLKEAIQNSNLDPDLIAAYIYNEESDSYGVRSGELIPLLIHAIQNLNDRIKILESN